MKLIGQIKGRLTTHGWKNSVRFFFGYDLFDGLWCQIHQVNLVGRHRVGHDGGRIRVDKDYLVSFRTQRSGCLATRIIEFARLSNNDGPRADQKNLLDVCAFWHEETTIR